MFYTKQVWKHLNSFDAGNPAWLRVQAHGSLRADLGRLKTFVDRMTATYDAEAGGEAEEAEDVD